MWAQNVVLTIYDVKMAPLIAACNTLGAKKIFPIKKFVFQYAFQTRFSLNMFGMYAASIFQPSHCGVLRGH